MGLELYHAVKGGNPEKFIHVLERASAEKCLPLIFIFDQVGNVGESLLQVAAQFGREKLAKLITCYYPTLLTRRTINGDTALHVAAKANSSNVIKIILSQYAAEKTNSTGNSMDNGDSELTRLITELGNTSLHEAVYSKHLNGVILLVLADKNVAHYVNKADDKPLPSYHGNSALHAAITTKNLEVSKHFHIAAKNGRDNVVKYLLRNKNFKQLIINEKDKNGISPLHLTSGEFYLDVLFSFTQDKRMDLSIRNNEGLRAIHVAAIK
ncbi:hypothetical protein L6164_037353 [Bauhinia variegata]|uniref:Uncharacterized protein n=1 Tax=Bauhinia variegata TaxID=167791 RepID=A0ACB9KJS0_BAUVA|nr:hypothetical protein L6164_037353 [Bauhinia variegata]